MTPFFRADANEPCSFSPVTTNNTVGLDILWIIAVDGFDGKVLKRKNKVPASIQFRASFSSSSLFLYFSVCCCSKLDVAVNERSMIITKKKRNVMKVLAYSMN
jgi:hypothetical protein